MSMSITQKIKCIVCLNRMRFEISFENSPACMGKVLGQESYLLISHSQKSCDFHKACIPRGLESSTGELNMGLMASAITI